MSSAKSRSRKWSFLWLVAVALLTVGATPGAVASDDWPAWRGPTRDGIAAPGQTPPQHWSETENILWRTPLPGRGHGSPTVVGDRIYLAAADQEKQQVLCFDRTTGQIVWDTVVHQGGLDQKGHANTSQASASVAGDGERLYINFLNRDSIYTTALDLRGKILWQQCVGDFVTHQGFASSPAIYESVVLVTADHKGGGTVAGLDRATGKILWQHARPKIPNYTSPAVLRAAGRTQLVVVGCKLVTSFDPVTGAKLWEIAGSTEECVGTAVTDGERVFSGGGYPKNHAMAVLADGSGKVAWENTSRVYVPSMIQEGGYLYAVLDAGMAVCWKAATGEEQWKERLGGEFFSSPVRVDGRMYATNLRGTTFVFEARSNGFKLLAQNQLGDEVYASPAICGNRIYMRIAKTGDVRKEYLVCIGAQAN